MTQLMRVGDVEVGKRLEREGAPSAFGESREARHSPAYEFVGAALIAATLGMFAIMIWGLLT